MKTIFMGQFSAIKIPNSIKTVLGSCVGIVLIDPVTSVVGMAHVMLPKCDLPKLDSPGKYADTAIPELLKAMNIVELHSGRLKAKIAGGANMFPGVVKEESLQIGKRNIAAVEAVLLDYKIGILAKDLGGIQGKELLFNGETKKVFTKIVGGQYKEI